VLLDYDLGQHDGREFMLSANRQGFRGKVLVVTAGVEKEQASQLIRSGISGIFMKHHSASLLIEGIRDAGAGKVWFDRELLQEAVGGRSARQESTTGQFTDRERQVLSYVFEGLANKEIADKLAISLSTVCWYLNEIYKKLHVRSRVQAVNKLRQSTPRPSTPRPRVTTALAHLAAAVPRSTRRHPWHYGYDLHRALKAGYVLHDRR